MQLNRSFLAIDYERTELGTFAILEWLSRLKIHCHDALVETLSNVILTVLKNINLEHKRFTTCTSTWHIGLEF